MRRHITHLAPILLTVLLFACSGKGPDVSDVGDNSRTQVTMMAIDAETGSELAIVREPDGAATRNAYADANGAPLGRRIDGIFESFDRLFLLHRESASITVVDLGTRQKLAEITGLPTPSRLNGMAFSNLSQGWVIDYDSRNVYHIDAVNKVLVDTLPIEGRPTSVATIADKVFVASQLDDGSGLVSVFQSNFTTYRIDRTYRYASPVVYMSTSGTGDAMVLVSAGAGASGPMVHVIKLATMEQSAERALSAPSLSSKIGEMPFFAGVTRENYLYLATEGEIFRVDVKSSRLTSQKWQPGTFPIIAADYWSGLLYAYDPAASTVRRFTAGGSELDPVAVPSTLSAIEFVNSTKVR